MRTLILFVAIASAACSAGRPGPAPLEVRDAWARPADSAAVTAAYLVIVNHEPTSITLSSVRSPLAESVTLHETMDMGGMVHMMALDSMQVIGGRDSLVLREGAKHLMVTGLRRTLVAGDSLPLELSFAGGRTVNVKAAVRAP